MQRDHISFSEWSVWIECQWKWFREYLEERRTEIYSSYIVFGKSIHSTLEALKDPDKKENRLSIDEACSFFEKEFREKYEEVRELDKKQLTDSDVDKFVQSGITIIRNLHKCKEVEDAQVLFVEHDLMEKIDRTDDVQIKFKGFIDLVIKTKDARGKSIVYIIDYKTCSWGWNSEKRRDEHLHAQLRLYKHFFCKKFKLDQKNVRCAFLLLKRLPKDDNATEWFPISAGPKSVTKALNVLNSAITGMNSNNFKKNRDACVNQYGDQCQYFGTELCTEDD